LISTWAEKIALAFKRREPDHPVSVAVLKYSISALLNVVLIWVLSLIAALFTGKMLETVVVLTAYAALRQVSGGFHLKSGVMCIVLTAIMVTALTYCSFGVNLTFILNGAACLLVLLFAPSSIQNQTRIPEKYFPLLKVVALLIVGLNFILGYSVLAATYLTQSLTLIRIRR
jgi:accessory gene regulator B